jgi:hypothetical protein
MKFKPLYVAVLGAALTLSVTGCGTSSNDPAPVAEAPKNVIFFLGDGMGMTTMTAARIYSVGEDGELTMDTLPETAFVKTFSNDAQVTDSAPSMSAYMTGVKMNNEVISMSPDTVAVDPVADANGNKLEIIAAPKMAPAPRHYWNWPKPKVCPLALSRPPALHMRHLPQPTHISAIAIWKMISLQQPFQAVPATTQRWAQQVWTY